MNHALHFAKAFGVCWAAAMASYVFVTFRWGFAVGWVRPPAPPMWALQMLFWLWPVIPAFLVAGLWEVIRVVGLHFGLHYRSMNHIR